VTKRAWLKTSGILASVLAGVLAVSSAAHANPADQAGTPGKPGKSAGVKVAAIRAADVTETFRNQSNGWYMSNFYWGMWDEVDSNAQWNVRQWNDGTIQLKTVGSGACLQSGGLGAVAGAMMSSTCDSSRVQSWYVLRWRDGTISFKNQSDGNCVAAYNRPGYPYLTLTMATCDSSPAQSWY
jgi:hypothetical protein